MVTNAREEGIAVKSASDHSVIANCIVFSNGGRGLRIRDSQGVIAFNNLVYGNGETGIDFGGEIRLQRCLTAANAGDFRTG